MAWSFGDGFDLYASSGNDAINGYWDSSPAAANNMFGSVGRFPGSRAATMAANVSASLLKASNVNDAVHHIVVAFQQTSVLSGTSNGTYLTLYDGATAQCSIVFRSDGVVLLTSGVYTGTTLATYTGAVGLASTWYAFEFEIVINNTTGSFAVRKNGNGVNDFTATGLNTRGGTANNYANRLGVGNGSGGIAGYIDDLFWRSDASSVAWMGDIRCYTRMPASDQSVQFSKAPTTVVQSIPSAGSVSTTPATTASSYSSYVASADGTVSSCTIFLNSGWTGNLKCTVFAGTAAGPTTIIASATTIVNPIAGNNTFTFTPFSVVKGTQYWIGFATDTAVTNSWQVSTTTAQGVGSGNRSSTTVGYAAFPVANPTVGNAATPVGTWSITVGTNNCLVNEPQQDAATSYVYDTTVGHADLYGVATIPSVPVSTIAVTTRGYAQKADFGTRAGVVQLKSGGTTVQSPAIVGGFAVGAWTWLWRTDLTDPATSAAWAASAVNAAQIGPIITA